MKDEMEVEWETASDQERFEIVLNILQHNARNFALISSDIHDLVEKLEEILMRLEDLEDKNGH